MKSLHLKYILFLRERKNSENRCLRYRKYGRTSKLSFKCTLYEVATFKFYKT